MAETRSNVENESNLKSLRNILFIQLLTQMRTSDRKNNM